ncbi:MAG: serine hydrolase domain-containing protein [bacterium]
MSTQRMSDAQSIGLDAQKVTQFLTRVKREVEEGLLPAAQVAIARNGQVGVFESFGAAQPDSLTPIFSATKAITSAAAWLLFQSGDLKEDERVVDIIPEFNTHGKEVVTVEQLFTHTAGFPHAPFKPLQWNNKEERYARFAQWRLSWPPGSRFEYHPSSSMWVIAEIIERRSGLGFTQFVRSKVLDPLLLNDLFVGLPAQQHHRALDCVHSGDALTPEDYQKMGMPVPPESEVTEDAILNFNTAAVREVGVPGGGGYATAADLALFHQALLHGGLDGVELWTPQTLASARRVRTGELTDMMFNKLANRGLGIIISGDESRSYRGFGKTNSPEAFGHNGAGGQLAWVDPATGLSLAYVTPGHDRNSIRQARRGVAISSLAAQLCA